MDITLLCCTHGRPYFLNEAVECWRRMNKPVGTTCEMLVLNDCPEQTLVGDIPGVRIVNMPLVGNLSLKMNAGFEEARGDWVAPLDDDDLSLPHRLTESWAYLLAHPDIMATRQQRAWVWEYGRITEWERNLFIGSAIFNKRFFFECGACKKESSTCWDNYIWFKMLETNRVVEIRPTRRTAHLVYRWGGMGFHYSGRMKVGGAASRLFNIYREGILTDPRFVPGVVEIKPHWNQDYVAMVKDEINKGVK